MTIELGEPSVGALDGVVGVLREWQNDGTPIQLHPGDVGWFWRFGAEATAAAVRTWSRGGRIVAVGLLDGPDLLRLAIAPDAKQDEDLARQMVTDVGQPERGVLPRTAVSVEAPPGALLYDLLGEAGWGVDEPWSLLRRDLAEQVEDASLRIETVGPEHVQAWVAVKQAAFGMTEDELALRRWYAMAAASPFVDARCLLAFDESKAVAVATVWSAGAGKCGVIEPMGVHPDHRRHGYGKAITIAAAATLAELGSASAFVCTPSANVGAVATYAAAGFQRLPERRDRRREPCP